MGKEVSLHLMATKQVPAQRRQIAKLFFSLTRRRVCPPPFGSGGRGWGESQFRRRDIPCVWVLYILTIYAPMIYMAPCIMFWMRADPLRGKVGRGWALEFESFLGPAKWHRADRQCHVQLKEVDVDL
jgi:hypothetical protein